MREKKIVTGLAIRCSIVIREIGLSRGARLVWKGAIRPLCGRLCGCVFHIFTGPEKKAWKYKAKKILPAACPYLRCATLLFYIFVVFFAAFKASLQKSPLKGIRPHAGWSLQIMKWWEVEKLIFSLPCIRRSVRVREHPTHANAAIGTSARLQLNLGRKQRRKKWLKKAVIWFQQGRFIYFFIQKNKVSCMAQHQQDWLVTAARLLSPNWQLVAPWTIAGKRLMLAVWMGLLK